MTEIANASEAKNATEIEATSTSAETVPSGQNITASPAAPVAAPTAVDAPAQPSANPTQVPAPTSADPADAPAAATSATTVPSQEAETTTPESVKPGAEAGPAAEVQPVIPAGPAPEIGKPGVELAPAPLGVGEHVVTFEEAKQAEQKAVDGSRAVVPPVSIGDGTGVQANPSAPIADSAVIAANPGSVISTKNKARDMLKNGGISAEQVDNMSHQDLQAVAEAHGWDDVANASRGSIRSRFMAKMKAAIDELTGDEQKIDGQ